MRFTVVGTKGGKRRSVAVDADSAEVAEAMLRRGGVDVEEVRIEGFTTALRYGGGIEHHVRNAMAGDGIFLRGMIGVAGVGLNAKRKRAAWRL